MSDPTPAIAAGFIRNFRDFGARVRTLSEGLSDTQFWAKPYPYGNSVGHLTLHITGNLNFFVGATLAGTGYVRDRPREFADPAPPTKEEALRRLDEAVAVVVATLERQTADDWSAPYAVPGMESIRDRVGLFLMCSTHFFHHVGQMIYLVKEHERQT